MCVRYGSEYHFITNYSKLDTLDKKFHWNTINPKTHAYILTKIDKMLENSAGESQ